MHGERRQLMGKKFIPIKFNDGDDGGIEDPLSNAIEFMGDRLRFADDAYNAGELGELFHQFACLRTDMEAASELLAELGMRDDPH